MEKQLVSGVIILYSSFLCIIYRNHLNHSDDIAIQPPT